MPDEHHLLLLIEYRQGQPLHEPVHVEAIGSGVYRLLYSPGFVQGIAAGDEFRLVGNDGAFEVLRRGGNLCIQVFCTEPVAPLQPELTRRLADLGGTLDGAIERGLAYTIPVSAGFSAVEAVLNAWTDEHESWEWYYGNVYDPVDGETPLRWWE